MSRVRVALATLLALVLALGGLTYYAVHTGLGPLPDPLTCRAHAEGYTTALSTAQAENASVIAAVAERRGLPARAISIAVAAAFQESKLLNLPGGDRDSLGLFQQRPSQGWGTRKQIMNRFHASNAFYDALVKVRGYQSMAISKAAQQVQRSAYPSAYAAHELDGRTVASAMSGYSHAAFTCVVDVASLRQQQPGANGLTARTNAVRRDVVHAFGPAPLGGHPQVHGAGSSATTRANPTGNARGTGQGLDIFFGPVSVDNARRGWVLASYLVANAERLHVTTVAFDGHRWSAAHSATRGWGRLADSPSARLAPRDRVVVQVG